VRYGGTLTGTATPSGEVLALSGTSSGLNVFAVTARSITIAVPVGGSALVNVVGASYSTAVREPTAPATAPCR
jgi:hypothetical protein